MGTLERHRPAAYFVIVGALLSMILALGSGKAHSAVTKWSPQLVAGCGQSIAADSSDRVYVSELGKVNRYSSQGVDSTLIYSGAQVLGLAAAQGGGVYVLTSERSVKRYDSQGTLVATLTFPASGSGGPDSDTNRRKLPDPRAIASDQQGNIYVADVNLERVKKFDSSGAWLATIGAAPGSPGRLDFYSGLKVAVSVDGSGNIYVSDETDRIQKFSSTGGFLTQWGGSGTGDSQFQELGSIAADASGRIYAGDRALSGQVKRFTTDGGYEGSSEPVRIVGLASASEAVVYALTCQGVSRIELSTPSVRVVVPKRPVIGEPATISAEASVPFGQVVKYEFDADGDGNFEESGSSPEVSVTFDSPSVRNITVRATSQLGGQATAGVSVRPVPPGAVGISLNGGDYATNSEDVAVGTVWPEGATAVTLSNDGGFGAAGNTETLDLDASIPWTMRDMGTEKVTRVVYARFNGSANPTQTYSDDIVLDKAPPVLEDADLLDESASTSARAKRFRVRIKGRQKRSGISVAQFSPRRSGGVTLQLRSRKVQGFKKLKKSVSVSSSVRPRYVRIQSAAGTWSRWKKLR